MSGPDQAAACPACGRRDTEPILHWPSIPANSALFVERADEAHAWPRGSFRLVGCRRCGLLHNADFDAALPEYSERNLESQLHSADFEAFANGLAADWVERHALAGRHVLEVGSGFDAGFLVRLLEAGVATGTALDPAAGPPPSSAIRVVRGRLDEQTAAEPAAALVCRHTLEHVAEPALFCRALRRFGESSPDAVLLFEVPDVTRVLRDTAFWDLYYEHCSYFTADTLAALFEREGFEVLRCEPVFGGQYLVLEARPSTAPRAAREVDTGALLAEAHAFAGRVEAARTAYRTAFEALAADGSVLVWQASSKALALITALGVGGLVEALVDVNPAKRGRFIVGSGHRVVGPADVPALAPRHVVVMNGIYADEIAATLRELGVEAELHVADSLVPGVAAR